MQPGIVYYLKTIINAEKTKSLQTLLLQLKSNNFCLEWLSYVKQLMDNYEPNKISRGQKKTEWKNFFDYSIFKSKYSCTLDEKLFLA